MTPPTTEEAGVETIPVIAEQLEVGTRRVETGSVRVSKRVVTEEVSVDVPLRREHVDIERVSVNRVVDQTAPIRHEGDVTIVPVYEEVLVRQLLLKEELHITRRASVEQRRIESVALRREAVEVTRAPLGDSAPADGETS